MRSLPRRNRLATMIAAAAAVTAMLAGCGSGAQEVGAAGPAASAGSAVPAALRFTAATVDGSTINGADLLAKPTVAWFWAPWCTVCRAEAPGVAAAAAKFGGQVNFVGIAGRGPVPDMARFVAETGVGGFRHAVDADGRLWSGFRVISQPAFAFVHPDGRIEVVNGSLGTGDLEARIADLMRT